jgi:hypothetical protein
MKKFLKRLFRYGNSTELPVTSCGRPPQENGGSVLLTSNAYLSDAPIGSKAQDTFNRWPFAKRIADTLAARKDASSIIIGLYGPWGDGKTSTLNMMAAALASQQDIVVVHFNPWLFRSEEQLLRGFFSTLAEAIDRSLSTSAEKIGEILKRYGSLLSVASIPVAPGVDLTPGDAAAGLGEALSEVKLEKLRERVEGFLAECGKRVIILIDDIDRLDRVETHAMLKLVKLSASFKQTSYVLAFDDEMVAAAIAERYAGGGADAGRGFLEKIIQVPLHLPPPDGIALRGTTFDGVQAALDASEITLSQEQADAFMQHFIDGLEPQLRTPRHAKLYANAVLFALPLLKGEANPVDLLLMEGIRIFCPKLYKAIRDNPDLFLHSDVVAAERDNARRQRVGELIDGALGGIVAEDKRRVRTGLLETLFPRLRNMGYGSDWDAAWEQEQRICSKHYFNRYFTYSVPPGDISDLDVGRLLTALEPVDAPVPDATLAEFAKKNAIPQLIRKLRRREDGIGLIAARRLALALGRNGALMPRERGTFFADATLTQGAILTVHLLRRITAGEEREALAAELIATAEPLSFATECFSWLHHNKDRPEERRIVSDEAEATIAPMLAERIRESANDAPLYATFGRDAPRMYWLWATHGAAADVRKNLADRFASHPNEVDPFLDTYVGEGRELESGKRVRADFDRGSYGAIAEVVDPNIILENLRQRYGAELDTAEFYQGNDVPIPLRFARQFAFVHRSVQKELAQAKDAAPKATDAAPDRKEGT